MALKKRLAQAPVPLFDVHAFLDSAGVSRRIVRFGRGAVVFSQGSPASSVFYIQDGGVKLSVLSSRGKEAIVAMLGAR
jgi:CRP/FNR family transcriptional regulator, cyclic AMP receptor protein